MNKSIEVMMSEHRLIEQVLGALDTFAAQLPEFGSASREVVAQFGTFFRDFADRCHQDRKSVV